MMRSLPLEATLNLGTGLSFSQGKINASAAALVTLNVQTFTASGTWTKPTGAMWVHILAIGGGGAGGAGTTANGGAAGCAGVSVEREASAVSLDATEVVTIGVGGVLSTGGDTIVDNPLGSTGFTFRAGGGSNAQAAVRTSFGNAIANSFGSGGAAATAGKVGMHIGAGGGGGGGNTGSTAGAAGGGGGLATWTSAIVSATGGGAAGGVGTTGGAGANAAVNASGFGDGGGGGGGHAAGTGGAGGAGIRGGGGGGGGRGTVAGGAAGVGGDGYCIISTICSV